jgi:hypothetical protein
MKTLLYFASAWGIVVDALLLLTYAQDPWDGWFWPTYLLISLAFYGYVGFVAYRGHPRSPRAIGGLFGIALGLAFVGMIGGLIFFSGALLALFVAWLASLRASSAVQRAGTAS